MRRLTTALAAGALNFREIEAAAARATAFFDDLTKALRWHRFDTFYGPMVGAVVILGTIAIATLAGVLAN